MGEKIGQLKLFNIERVLYDKPEKREDKMAAPPEFKEGDNRREKLLFPPSIDEYLPDSHLARVVLDIVRQLDLSNIEKKYSKEGQHAYSPEILLSLLFYGYATGIRSSRRLAKACEERVDFMYLSARSTPSYKTISEFRRKHLKEIRQLFREIVRIGIELGLVEVGNIKISIDGTKVRANAASKKSKDEDGLNKLLSKIDKKIDNILEEAEEIDREEDEKYGDRRGDELPKELKKLKTRKKKIKEAIKELSEKKESKKKEITQEKGSLNAREKKKINKIKINLTDRDAKYMKERHGVIKANYNAQISADEEEQFIVANSISDNPTDYDQLISLIEQTQDNTGSNHIKEAKADSGYHSQDNLEDLEKKVDNGELGEYLIDDPDKKKIDNEEYKFDKVNFKYDKEKDVYICPDGKIVEFFKSRKKRGHSYKVYKCYGCDGCKYQGKCTRGKYRMIYRRVGEEVVEKNREKMMKEEKWKAYKKRMHTVEPPFGNIKFNLGYLQFLLRGKEKVGGEFNLMCIGHNIKKIGGKIEELGTPLKETIEMYGKQPELNPI